MFRTLEKGYSEQEHGNGAVAEAGWEVDVYDGGCFRVSVLGLLYVRTKSTIPERRQLQDQRP